MYYNEVMENNNLESVFNNIWWWFEDKGMHDPVMQFCKVNEEVGELAREITRSTKDKDAIADAIGDSIITLIGMAHAYDLDASECVRKAYNIIKDRHGKVVNGSFVKDEDKI